tara:strand:+ start:34152 stop:34973 length:822 start_codon:yes stop_codon:yes gene_type:complete
MLTINGKSSSLAVQNLLNNITNDLETTSARLSSGKRILSASDDPAGLAIASRMKSDLASYGAVSKNIDAGVSLLEVTNTALNSGTEILTQMKTLAVQSSNDSLSAEQRTSIQTAFSELQSQYEETIGNAELFGKNLLATGGADVDFQTGINAGDTYTVAAADSSGATLGVDSATIQVDSIANAQTAITAIDTAITDLGVNQSVIGANQSALEQRSSFVASLTENIESARSRIEDADIAKETSKLAELQTKQQMATSMLGLVNSFPRNALSLLG